MVFQITFNHRYLQHTGIVGFGQFPSHVNLSVISHTTVYKQHSCQNTWHWFNWN